MNRLRISAGVALAMVAARLATAAHPLDPLTTHELISTVEILRKESQVTTNTTFPMMALREPAKASVLSWRPGAKLPREAFVITYDLAKHRTDEAIVNLDDRRVTEWRPRPGVEPPFTLTFLEASSRLLETNELWLAALRRRGITNAALVDGGGIPAGLIPPPAGVAGVLLLRSTPFHKTETHTTWEPIEGLEAIFDWSHQKVLQVIDYGVFPRSSSSMDFYDPAVRGRREALKPLVTTQPEGASFTVKDHEVSWDRWRFRYSLHPRDGLVLHQISWEEAPGQRRSVLYRASVSDLLVPYADTDRAWSWRAYFDESDFGLGLFAKPLFRGATTVAHATLLSEPLPDQLGGAQLATNVVDLYERDAGFLWAHHDDAAGTAGPRARELVIGFLSTIGNYDYRFQWSFRQDGSIEFHVYLTGLMQLKGTHAKACAACGALANKPGSFTGEGEQARGTLVADHLLAPHHQHWFNLRLDFDVDGTGNSIKEVNLATDRRGRANPDGNGFSLTQTVFARERQAVRNLNPASHRMWAVFNPNALSPLGHPAAYFIEPGMNTVPFLHRDSPVRKRAGFIDHHFFATRHRETELYASGDYPIGHHRARHLGTWARDNEKIVNEDVVAWYTLGVTHVGRPEDFPVMPAAHASVRLVPKAFFERNPALDVPDALVPDENRP